MKKIIISVICCVSVISVYAQNLLRNPDFEEHKPAKLSAALKKYLEADEIPSGWSVNPPGNPSKFTVMTDAETSQKGSVYLRVEQKDPQKSSSCSQWWLPIQGGKQYTLSVFAKGKGKLLLNITAYGEKKNLIGGGSSKFTTLTADWKEYSYSIKLPQNTKFANVHFKMNGVVDLDNASLKAAK